MKKLILSLTAVAAIAFGASAQTNKGQFILGGTASYESVKSDASGARAAQNLNLVPNVGYFVSDNFALGTGIGYELQKAATAGPAGQTEAFVVSPFGRYYVGLGDQFKFFGQASVPMAFGATKAIDAEGDVTTKTGNYSSIGAALSPGFAYFPTSKIGIEFAFRGVSYSSSKVQDADGDDIPGLGTERFSIGTSFFTPQIGIQFHF